MTRSLIALCVLTATVTVTRAQECLATFDAPLVSLQEPSAPPFTALVDFDGDGDEDALGENVVRGRVHHGASSGIRQQYGARVAGTGGAAPIWGATGPFRAGEMATARLRGGLGGSVAAIAFGLGAVTWTNFPVGGITLYVDPFTPPAVTWAPVPLDGPPGAAGAGGFDLPIAIPASFIGGTIYHQALVLDLQGPGGWAATNALRITYGS